MKDLSELKKLRSINDVMRLKERLRYDVLISEQHLKSSMSNLKISFFDSIRDTLRSYGQEMIKHVILGIINRARE
ncbi:MAG: hypothetical protein KQI35_08255 [Bacteroidetes bacterium]|nr:hypothetical protein [Bacteroidota bacterium]